MSDSNRIEKPKVIQIYPESKELRDKFEDFCRKEGRSETNAGNMILRKFFEQQNTPK